MVFKPFLNFLVQGICFRLTSLQNTVNIFIRDGSSLRLDNHRGSKLKHFLHFVFGEGFISLRVFGLLDNKIVPFKFDGLAFYDFLLDCILSNKSVYIDRIFLANTMCPVHSLQIHLRVPIAIINNDSVSAG